MLYSHVEAKPPTANAGSPTPRRLARLTPGGARTRSTPRAHAAATRLHRAADRGTPVHTQQTSGLQAHAQQFTTRSPAQERRVARTISRSEHGAQSTGPLKITREGRVGISIESEARVLGGARHSSTSVQVGLRREHSCESSNNDARRPNSYPMTPLASVTRDTKMCMRRVDCCDDCKKVPERAGVWSVHDGRGSDTARERWCETTESRVVKLAASSCCRATP